MLHQPENAHFVALRNLHAPRTYRVWIRRGSAVAVHDYRAASGEAAIPQARAELERIESAFRHLRA